MSEQLDACKELDCLDEPKVKNSECPDEPYKAIQIFGNAELLGGDSSPIELTPDQINLLCGGLEPCGKLTQDKVRVINTAIYWLGQQIEMLCQRLAVIENDPCGFVADCIPEYRSYTPVSVTQMYSTGNEASTSTLPVNNAFDAGSIVPADATAFVIRSFLEVDSANTGPDTVGVSLSVNGQFLGNSETGGPSGSGDNQWVGDFIIPRNNGDTITTSLVLDYDSGNQGSYQATTRLVGYF